MPPSDMLAAMAAHRASASALLQRPDVIAVGIGDKRVADRSTGETAVKVFVRQKLPLAQLAPAMRIPAYLPSGGPFLVATDLEEMIMPTAPPSPTNFVPTRVIDPARLGELRQYRRPVLAGSSGGHYLFLTGTVGAVVHDRAFPAATYLLSNNHVFALLNGASIGDGIVQPARIDGGLTAGFLVGRLARFVPLRLGPNTTNVVDAAIARVAPAAACATISFLGTPKAVRLARSILHGEHVLKVGRSSGLTAGTISAVFASTKVSYAVAGFGPQQTILTNQIFTTPMAAFGDSGSPLVDGSLNVLGLLAAGSATTTVFNYMEFVQDMLGVVVAGVPDASDCFPPLR